MGKYRVSSGSRCNPAISDKPFTLTVNSGSWRPAMGIIAWIVLGAIVGIIAEKAHRRANRPAPGDRRGHPRRPARRLAREGPFPRPHPRHLLRPQHLGHRHRRRGRPAARRGSPNRSRWPSWSWWPSQPAAPAAVARGSEVCARPPDPSQPNARCGAANQAMRHVGSSAPRWQPRPRSSRPRS